MLFMMVCVHWPAEVNIKLGSESFRVI